jgi:hypothetical protein
MMCISCMSREIREFKIIIIYTFFIEFIDNKKLEDSHRIDNDVHIIHV